MHEILHLLGICADHDAHLNLISVLGDNAIMNNINLSAKQTFHYIKGKASISRSFLPIAEKKSPSNDVT